MAGAVLATPRLDKGRIRLATPGLQSIPEILCEIRAADLLQTMTLCPVPVVGTRASRYLYHPSTFRTLYAPIWTPTISSRAPVLRVRAVLASHSQRAPRARFVRQEEDSAPGSDIRHRRLRRRATALLPPGE